MKRYLPMLILALLAACHTVRHPVPAAVTKTEETAAVRNETKRPDPPKVVVDGSPEPPHRNPVEDRSNPPRNIAGVITDLFDHLQDAYFDYDRSAVRPDAIAALETDARILAPALAEFPQLTVTVEGHCDERGSAEYNIGLGDHRAQRAAEILYQSGIPRDRVQIVTYGKEAPQCRESNEACWQRNRRAHLVPRAGAPTL